jgi:hypothetical protein
VAAGVEFGLGASGVLPSSSSTPGGQSVAFVSAGFASKVLVLRFLCATSVFSVSLWLMNSEQKHTTETQRTQRLHREERHCDF